MLNILCVYGPNGNLSDLQAYFESLDSIQVSRSESGIKAMTKVLNDDLQLLIVDETLTDMSGLELVEKIVVVNPIINCALVSPLSRDDFHEASEGLGVLMQLPPRPSETEGRELLKCLKQILRLDETPGAGEKGAER